MTKKVIISIIIPTYNRYSLLQKTIKSVSYQTFTFYEVIIIDDGSTDETEKKIRNLLDNNERIKYFRIPHSGLPAVARNIGISLSTGNYIAFLDSDDLWLPSKLDEQMAIFMKYPDVGIESCNAYRLQKGDKISNTLYLPDNDNYHGPLLPRIIKSNTIILSSVIIKRDLFLKTGIKFNESPKYKALEDYDLWLKLGCKTGYYYSAQPLVVYRDQGGSIRDEQRIQSEFIILFIMNTKNLQRLSWDCKLSLLTKIETIRYIFEKNLGLCKELSKYGSKNQNKHSWLWKGMQYTFKIGFLVILLLSRYCFHKKV